MSDIATREGASVPARTVRRRRGALGPRRGMKRTLLTTITQIPAYLRLLSGLFRDPRVAVMDKLLVAGAILYIVSPLDLVPDFVPFLGQVDDVYLLILSLQRLVRNAGRRVVTQHWSGDPAELEDINFRRVLAAAAFFLPRRVRGRLRRFGRH